MWHKQRFYLCARIVLAIDIGTVRIVPSWNSWLLIAVQLYCIGFAFGFPYPSCPIPTELDFVEAANRRRLTVMTIIRPVQTPWNGWMAPWPQPGNTMKHQTEHDRYMIDRYDWTIVDDHGWSGFIRFCIAWLDFGWLWYHQVMRSFKSE